MVHTLATVFKEWKIKELADYVPLKHIWLLQDAVITNSTEARVFTYSNQTTFKKI